MFRLLAVSLGGLQRALARCSGGPCNPDLLQLGGMNRVLGVLIDREPRDVVLIGLREPLRPPLQTDDLAVALRHAWLKYAVRDGDHYVYSHPGCSIDPVPDVIRALDAIGHELSIAAPSAQKGLLARWHDVCQTPQAVRVLGVPADTHFAQVMVQADYDLKRLADGTDSPQGDWLLSVSERSMRRSRLAFETSATVAEAPASGLNRFWFSPEGPLYDAAEGIVLFRRCGLRLLTEWMHAGASGEVAPSGRDDPLARVFARDVTVLYGSLAAARPVFAELQGLFELEAVAQVLKHVSGEAVADGLRYLLEEHRVAAVPVPRELPGRSAVSEWSGERATFRGRNQIQITVPSCGGVDMDMDVAGSLAPSADPRLARLRREILESRGAASRLRWLLPDRSGYLDDLETGTRVRRINEASRCARLVTIESVGALFKVAAGDEVRSYHATEIPRLMKDIAVAVGGPDLEALYVDLHGFATPQKAEAFLETCRLQQEFPARKVVVRGLSRENVTARDLQDAFLQPGASVDERAPAGVRQLTEGPYRGLFETRLSLVARLRNGVARIVVRVVARTQEIALRFVELVKEVLGHPLLGATSAADAFTRARRELRRTFPNEDILVWIEGDDAKAQLRRTYMVQRAPVAVGEAA